MTHRHLDPEGIAFRAGLRAGIRAAVREELVPDVVGRFERLGVVRPVDTPVTIGGGREVYLVYAAHDDATLDEIAEAEAPLYTRPETLSADDFFDRHRRIGRVLGYPECCTEAYIRWTRRGIGRLEGYGRQVAGEAYTAVHGAWAEAPSAYANDLLMAYGVFWISFFPCSYGCARADALGRATFEAAREEVGNDALEHQAMLERDVAIGRWGARTIVRVEGDVVTHAHPPVGLGGRVDERDSDFAGRLIGARVGGDGRMELAADRRDADPHAPAPIVVRFGSGGG